MKLQEAADALSANDIRSRLSDAISDAHRGSGRWAYYVDHFGDAESGDVVFSCEGETQQAPYEISTANGGAAVCTIALDQAINVVPRTIYEPEADEADHYAAMEAAFKAEKLYDALPLYERFISKAERDKASADDFAGKGKSFPILQPGDVMAAVRSIGRAGSGNLGPSGIKSRIIAIAKRKGWEKYLPKSWRDTSASESAGVVSRETGETGALVLVEGAATLETIRLQEARSDYEIKLIAPGKGSSAFYPAEVLKRDGPNVFKAGTHVYLNHPTAAEEAARPEGDVANLAGVLTTAAEYRESHPKGEGLYARMKVFADHAQTVEEKAPHVGMSIRASGLAEAGTKRDGLPVLKSLTSAESVDVVTRAGAGGMILTESARTQPATSNQEQTDMDNAALTALQESNRRLLERALRSDAEIEARRILGTTSLHEAARTLVVENVIGTPGAYRPLPINATSNELDSAKLKELVEAEAKRVGAVIAASTGSGNVRGFGQPVESIDPKEAERRAAEEKAQNDRAISVFESITGDRKVAEIAARGRVA